MFIFSMWLLILLGGGILVFLIAPITITGYGDWSGLIASGIKGLIAIALVTMWIFFLSKVKNWIFKKQLNFEEKE